jgi:L-amino acid N-acyltransferase YncA
VTVTTDVTVRFATEEDYPSLRRRARWLDYENRKYGQESVEQEIVSAMSHAFRTNQNIVVAENKGGEIVGFCAWVSLPISRPGEAMGVGTYVTPEYQRTGISSAMRQVMERDLRARGITSVVGVAAAGNWGGLESALKAGFSVTGWVVKKELGDEEVGIVEERGH